MENTPDCFMPNIETNRKNMKAGYNEKFFKNKKQQYLYF
jgi:hypothetical protein